MNKFIPVLVDATLFYRKNFQSNVEKKWSKHGVVNLLQHQICSKYLVDALTLQLRLHLKLLTYGGGNKLRL